jgi:DNA-binding transcriptional LysR family regulator
VQLTAEGRNAVPHAERLLNASQEFERLGRAGPALEGVLRLGSDESTAMVALSEILSRLKRRHPKLVVELSIDIGAVLKEKLRKREIDMALHTNAGAASHVIDELLGWVDFQWVASRELDIPAGDFTPSWRPSCRSSPTRRPRRSMRWCRNGCAAAASSWKA